MKFLISTAATIMSMAALCGSLGAQAANCSDTPEWQAGNVYTSGMTVTFNSSQYRANWWTNNSPATHSGQWQEWTNQGVCENNALDALLQNPANSEITRTPSVRVFYLIPSDQRRNTEFEKAIFHATKHMQDYYLKQVDNQKTFTLKRPNAPVEVIGTDKSSSWFRDNNPNNNTNWVAWFNSRDELARIVGERPADERWIAYVDSEPVCDQNSGGAAGGVAIMMREDMLGLTNASSQAACANHVWNDPFRWIGGLAHEAGHTFDLPHDDGCSSCLMDTGYTIYPNAVLRENAAGLPTLRASEFFTRLPQINAVFDRWETQQALATTATRTFDFGGQKLYFRQYAGNKFFIAQGDDLFQVVGSTKDNKGSISALFVGIGNVLNPASADYLGAISSPVNPQ